MRLVKVGVASVNSTVGALSGNTDRAVRWAHAMAADDVTLGVFPEQVLGGYPPEDLVQWAGFVDRQWAALERFASETQRLSTVFVLGLVVAEKGMRYNCAAVVAEGRILGLVPKEKLPSYSVFYEERNYTPGREGLQGAHRGVPLGDFLFSADFGVFAVEVCEDLWSPDGPQRRRALGGAECVVNVSASPFRVGIPQTRRELIATRAADNQVALVYANAVGANDGLIFDGGGYVNQNGKSMLEAPRFVEGFASVVLDLNRTVRLRSENSTFRQDRESWARTHAPLPLISVPVRTQRTRLAYPMPASRRFFTPEEAPEPPAREQFYEDVLHALALGVGDYFEKTKAFSSMGLALSGGRDSLLTLLVAYRAAQRLRPENPGSLLHAFYMPTRYSSAATRLAAETIARDLGVHFQILSIEEAFERELEATSAMLKGAEVTALTRQNIQARLRAQRMWNWANSSGALFLQTGNMSEKAVGYTTVGGDLMGGLAVIANVPKTLVMGLLDYLYAKHRYPGIAEALKQPAGPELAEHQVGENELMPFPILDACLHLFASEKLLPQEVKTALAGAFPTTPPAQLSDFVDKFARLFSQSIYKWVQSPLSLHLGALDLDRERALQLPVVTHDDWRR